MPAKPTGVARPVDHLDRIVLPSEIRQAFSIQTGTPLEFFCDGKQIAIRRLEVDCVFCNSQDDLSYFRNRLVCRGCLEALGGRK